MKSQHPIQFLLALLLVLTACLTGCKSKSTPAAEPTAKPEVRTPQPSRYEQVTSKDFFLQSMAQTFTTKLVARSNVANAPHKLVIAFEDPGSQQSTLDAFCAKLQAMPDFTDNFILIRLKYKEDPKTLVKEIDLDTAKRHPDGTPVERKYPPDSIYNVSTEYSETGRDLQLGWRVTHTLSGRLLMRQTERRSLPTSSN